MTFQKLYAVGKSAVGTRCFAALRRYRTALDREAAVHTKSNGISPCVAAVDVLAGVYKKRTRAVLFALHRQRTCGVNSVDINFICIRTVQRRRFTAADDSVFRAVRQNNGRAIRQLDCGRCRGGKVSTFQRKGLGAVIPC